jgi:hypothetical protein
MLGLGLFGVDGATLETLLSYSLQFTYINTEKLVTEQQLCRELTAPSMFPFLVIWRSMLKSAKTNPRKPPIYINRYEFKADLHLSHWSIETTTTSSNLLFSFRFVEAITKKDYANIIPIDLNCCIWNSRNLLVSSSATIKW